MTETAKEFIEKNSFEFNLCENCGESKLEYDCERSAPAYICQNCGAIHYEKPSEDWLRVNELRNWFFSRQKQIDEELTHWKVRHLCEDRARKHKPLLQAEAWCEFLEAIK